MLATDPAVSACGKNFQILHFLKKGKQEKKPHHILKLSLPRAPLISPNLTSNFSQIFLGVFFYSDPLEQSSRSIEKLGVFTSACLPGSLMLLSEADVHQQG